MFRQTLLTRIPNGGGAVSDNVEAPRVRRQLRLLKGSDRAFEQLYRQHAREVYQYALAVLANPADAEDVTQTTFLNAYRAFQRGERPHKPHNWLIAIAHNVCRMRWRQAGSRPREVALEQAAEPAAPENGQADLDEVLAALATLTFNQRAAIVMRELEGRTYQEISEVLGVSVSAVEALLFRARRRLQVNRKTLGVITTVPLPGSLGSFIGAGGGGAAAVGGSLVVKAGTVLAVGTAAAGLGLKGVEAVDAPKTAPAQASIRPAPAAPTKHTISARHGTQPRAKTRPTRENHRRAVSRSSRPERTQMPAGAAPAPAPPAPPASVGTAPPASPALVKPPALPTLPPVTLPQAPQLPPVPPVKLPQLPPPPALPPLPPVKLPPLPPLPPLNTP